LQQAGPHQGLSWYTIQPAAHAAEHGRSKAREGRCGFCWNGSLSNGAAWRFGWPSRCSPSRSFFATALISGGRGELRWPRFWAWWVFLLESLNEPGESPPNNRVRKPGIPVLRERSQGWQTVWKGTNA